MGAEVNFYVFCVTEEGLIRILCYQECVQEVYWIGRTTVLDWEMICYRFSTTHFLKQSKSCFLDAIVLSM